MTETGSSRGIGCLLSFDLYSLSICKQLDGDFGFCSRIGGGSGRAGKRAGVNGGFQFDAGACTCSNSGTGKGSGGGWSAVMGSGRGMLTLRAHTLCSHRATPLQPGPRQTERTATTSNRDLTRQTHTRTLQARPKTLIRRNTINCQHTVLFTALTHILLLA